MRAALGPPAAQPETDLPLFQQGFILADGRLMSAPGRDFEREPLNILRILQVARDRHLQLHPLAMRALIRHERQAIGLRTEPEAAAMFTDLLFAGGDGARWMAILNEAGFLSRFIPDWARIVGQMQFDTYHVFTVDEHTIEGAPGARSARARRPEGGRADREPGWWRICNLGARCMSRRCCTTSLRAAAATTPSSAPRLHSKSARRSGCPAKKPRR